jgi:electron transport complex protein RnfC
MTRVREFRHGGVAVDHRVPYRPVSIENAFLPMNAIVVLKDAKVSIEPLPVVSVGQEVREGQLLAKSTGKGSANVHSPIPGIVRRIETVTTPGGYQSRVIVISLAGSFSMLGKRSERYLWKSLNKADIAHIIQEKGIVCVSSGRPLHDVMTEHVDHPESIMVISALEMDPYRRTEEALMEQRTEDVVDGWAIAARVVLPSRVIVALDEGVSPEVLQRLTSIMAASELEASIELFRRRFPQDMRGQIVNALGLEQAVHLFVLEPSTLVALHDAVVSNKPHIEQYVYVGGGAIKHPGILKARIGAPIGDLIEECGGFLGQPARLVIGGPFRGRLAADLDVSVTRSTRAVLALTAAETRSAPERACVRCGDCVVACPEGLDPFRLLKLLRAGRRDDAVAIGLERCSTCGACAYVCRSRIPLAHIFDMAREGGQVQ